MRHMILSAVMAVVWALAGATPGQADDNFGRIVNRHKVYDGDDYRRQRDHDLGRRDGGRDWNGGRDRYNNRDHYRPPTPPRWRDDNDRRDSGNNRYDRYNNDRNDRRGRLLYDDFERERRFRLSEQSYDRRGKYRESYRSKDVDDYAYENRRRTYENRNRRNSGGERLGPVGTDWNGYSDREFSRERGRGMRGGYSTGHGITFGFR